MKQRLNHLFSVIILLIGLSLFIFMSNADLRIARLIFSHNYQYPGLYHEPWTFLYTMAPIPGILLTIGALAVLFAGFFYSCLPQA